MDKLNSITVKSGDNLWYIATEQVKQKGSTSAADIAKAWNKIINYNQDKGGLKNPDLIYAGDEILLPLEFAMEEIAANIDSKIAEYDTALTNNSANLETIVADLQAMYEELEELYNECETPEDQQLIIGMAQIIEKAFDPNYTPSANAGNAVSEDQVDFGDKAPASSKTQEELKNDLVETATIGLYALMTNEWVEHGKGTKAGKADIAASYLTGLSNEELKSIVKNLQDKLDLRGKEFDYKIEEIFGEEGFETLKPYLSGKVETESQEYSDEDLYEMQMNIWKNSLYPEIHYDVIQDLLATMTQDEKAAFKQYFDAKNDVSFDDFMKAKINDVKELAIEDDSLQEGGENYWKITFLNDIHALVLYADSDLSVLKSANEMTPEEQEQVTKELYFEMIDMAITAKNVRQLEQVVEELIKENSYDILAYVAEQYKARWGKDLTETLKEESVNDKITTAFENAPEKAKNNVTKFDKDSVNGARLRMIDTATECNTSADEEATTGRDNNITEDDIWSNQTWLRAMMNLSDEDLRAINQMWGNKLSDQIKQGLNLDNKEFSETQLNTFLARLEKLGIGKKYDIEKTEETTQSALHNDWAYAVATQLHAAIACGDRQNCDEETVGKILLSLDGPDLLAVVEAWNKYYDGSSNDEGLIERLRAELESDGYGLTIDGVEYDSEIDLCNAIVAKIEAAQVNKDGNKRTLNEDDVLEAWSEAMDQATLYYKGDDGTNESLVYKIIFGKSDEQLSKLMDYYDTKHKKTDGFTFRELVADELEDVAVEVTEMLNEKMNDAEEYKDYSKMSEQEKLEFDFVDALCMELHSAMVEEGTNKDTVDEIINEICGKDPGLMYKVIERYKDKYGDEDFKTLEERIKDEDDLDFDDDYGTNFHKADKDVAIKTTITQEDITAHRANAIYVMYKHMTSGDGTDEKVAAEILSCTKEELEAIDEYLKDKYTIGLREILESEFSDESELAENMIKWALKKKGL